MRICIGIASISLLSFSSSFAFTPRYFVGGSTHIGAILETLSPGHTSGCTVSNPQIYTTYGGHVEGGIRGNFWDVHTGFHFSYARDHERHDNNSGHFNSGWESTENWYNYRFTAGARLHVSENYPNSVKPTIGAGITYGWLRRTDKYEHWAIYQGSQPSRYSEYEAKNYKGCWGWLAEAGFYVVPRGRLRYSLLFRWEDYDLDKNDIPLYSQAFNGAVQLSAELGVHYTFPRLTH